MDPSNGSIVLCNDTLKSLFQVDSFKPFTQLQSLLKPHCGN
jgi:chromatin remodeling complex protein RSC6